jgi:hypothetical protein
MTIKAYGASVIGRSHLAAGTPCHDAHAFQAFQDNAYIAVVLDGMGSAAHAEKGSRLAADTVLELLLSSITLDLSDEDVIIAVKEAFMKTQERLQEEADDLDIDIRDLNATLLVYLSLDDRQFYGQVGDCAAIGKTDDGYQVIARQQRGEYANATFSVCNPQSVLDGIYEKTTTFFPHVALMSDGIESISVSAKDKTVSALFFDPFFNAFEKEGFDQETVSNSLARFLSSDRINQKTDDDKTLLFVMAKD